MCIWYETNMIHIRNQKTSELRSKNAMNEFFCSKENCKAFIFMAVCT